MLGAGAFGQVTLVKHGGRCYALKTLAKMHIVQTGLTVRDQAGTDALWVL